MEQILFDQLPKVIQSKLPCSEKFTKYVSCESLPQGNVYFVYETTEVNAYLHINNENEEKALLVMKVPFTWLRLAADQIPGVADYLDEIVQYAKMEKEDE